MKRMHIKHIVLGILLVGLPGCFSCNKERPAAITKQTIVTVTPLNGEQTAQRISKLYNELGPRIGVHLVEPNAVLTMSGMRGSGNFLMHNLTDEEILKLEMANEKLKKFGIQFIVHNDVEQEGASIDIFNIKGLEYSSKLSKLPFVTPFDSSTGEGYQNWQQEVANKAKKYFEDKGIHTPAEQHDLLGHFMLGLSFGYPDQALLDAYETKFDNSKLAHRNIPYSDYYDNPQPNFSYLPEHEHEESIANIKKSWGKLLEDFYNSSWHKAIAKDPVFIQTMQSERKAHNDWFKRNRLKLVQKKQIECASGERSESNVYR